MLWSTTLSGCKLTEPDVVTMRRIWYSVNGVYAGLLCHAAGVNSSCCVVLLVLHGAHGKQLKPGAHDAIFIG